MTFDPGVGVPPTGAAASLAPRFLTVSRFYWSQRNVPGLFPIWSGTNQERCSCLCALSRFGKHPRIKGHFIQTIYNIH